MTETPTGRFIVTVERNATGERFEVYFDRDLLFVGPVGVPPGAVKAAKGGSTREFSFIRARAETR